MIENIDQEIGCKFFLELYHYKNRQIFIRKPLCRYDNLPDGL